MLKLAKRLLVGFVFFCAVGSVFALKVPSIAGTPLHDYAQVFSPSEADEIKTKLLELYESGKIQFAVMTVDTLEDETIESYALKVFNQWGLGSAETDKGLLLLIAYEEHKVRFEVGYGLEAIVTDARAASIIRNIIVPHFQNDEFGEGVNKAIDIVAEMLESEDALALIDEYGVASDYESDLNFIEEILWLDLLFSDADLWVKIVVFSIYYSVLAFCFFGIIGVVYLPLSQIFKFQIPFVHPFLVFCTRVVLRILVSALAGGGGSGGRGYSGGGGSGGRGYSGGGGSSGGGGASGGW